MSFLCRVMFPRVCVREGRRKAQECGTDAVFVPALTRAVVCFSALVPEHRSVPGLRGGHARAAPRHVLVGLGRRVAVQAERDKALSGLPAAAVRAEARGVRAARPLGVEAALAHAAPAEGRVGVQARVSGEAHAAGAGRSSSGLARLGRTRLIGHAHALGHAERPLVARGPGVARGHAEEAEERRATGDAPGQTVEDTPVVRALLTHEARWVSVWARVCDECESGKWWLSTREREVEPTHEAAVGAQEAAAAPAVAVLPVGRKAAVVPGTGYRGIDIEREDWGRASASMFRRRFWRW
ncbi:hypothetical protein FIBSPDRAFT_955684 [Athelia psychrophila]|uniref:Uncharacterized protein n=1 Tax=Athelia psychrophila TaxID=1759441 RepID=A0A166HRA3_9AGAM|nr:hypothetical protein FIBSPDRAFT_955684 [Fibularhizoctonia sp. CBS 109695]